MTLWNGIAMYAPLTPEYYAIPGTAHCVFRVMQAHGDTHAWNLYWLSKPETDLLLAHQDSWFQHYRSLDPVQTEAFYAALDTVVLNRMTLASIVALPPREAIALLRKADLHKTRFYKIFGEERWRQTMLGRLFLAARLDETTGEQENDHDAQIVWIDFHTPHPTLKNGTRHRRP